MNARISQSVARNVVLAIRGIRHASTQPPLSKMAQKAANAGFEHGHRIYVYRHLQRNHVVYSLTKVLKNNKALSQLPFNGKKTVPRALRKDLWYPMAIISFPPGASAIGLSAFQRLREYRRRHELEWNLEDYKDEEGKLLSRRKRGLKLCDQKANSVADIADVLGRLAKRDIEPKDKVGMTGEGTGAEVTIQWGDLLDSEFASTWSDNVVHDAMEMHTNHRKVKKFTVDPEEDGPEEGGEER